APSIGGGATLRRRRRGADQAVGAKNGKPGRMEMSFAALAHVSAAALVLGFASVSHADFPDRAIKIESGFPAGGGADILIRWYAEKLRELTGQPVVIENKPGAGGNLGTDALVKSKPDGYTIMMAPSSAIAGNIYLYKNLPFNLRTDIVPVITLAQLA